MRFPALSALPALPALLSAVALVFAACESTTGPASNVEFGLSECLNEAVKTGVGSATGLEAELIFRSKDSLSIAFPVVLLCKAEYAMIASVVSPETLSVAITDVGSYRSKCVCDKTVTIGFKSPSGGLQAIRFVKAEGQVFELK